VALDQFEQVDRRNAFGTNVSQVRNFHVGGRDGILSYGLDFRRDRIGEVGLYDTQQRTRLATVRSDKVNLDALGLWSQAELELSPQWRTIAGLRWDRHAADVASSVAANSGSNTASITSPKLGLVWAPLATLDVYGNWGRGFHSNDARGTVIRVDPRDGVTPVAAANALVRAEGYELGTRQRWGDKLTTTMALWTLRLGSELLFVGDAGTTEPSRPSRRSGVELTANWRPAAGWEIDSDLSLSRARFTDIDPAGDRIPGALERVLSVGATWQDGPWTVGARLRFFGTHPLIEDNSIRGVASTVVNLRTAYAITPRTQLSLDVFNLFDRRIDDIQYAYGSRLPGEAPYVDGVTPPTLHVHPGVPRTLRAGLRVSW
jgi:outer membrane receptor protein involved in Fe transport